MEQPYPGQPKPGADGIRIRGARTHNLDNVDVDIPRDAIVAFTGVSGSGKSSLAFATIYAESQRRYFESVAPYARRLMSQVSVPDVDAIEGLPPAVALPQQRSGGNSRSTVGSATTIANVVRMLMSRVGSYPAGAPMLFAEDFSTNTVEGACPTCHGLGQVYDVPESRMVPDGSLSIRDGALAAWPSAWHGQQLRDSLVSLGYDVDIPWREISQSRRDWALYTRETPQVPVFRGLTTQQVWAAVERGDEPSYMSSFVGVQRYVLDTFANSKSARMRERAASFMVSVACPQCHGKRLKQEALSVTFEGYDVTELSGLPIDDVAALFQRVLDPSWEPLRESTSVAPERRLAAQQLAKEALSRIAPLADLGLGYLSLDRATSTLSSGELQRMRLATQVLSQLFGVVFVLDEPSAGLHPADTEALLGVLSSLKTAGNTVFLVEHSLDVIRAADWIVDIGPGAGAAGGAVVYSGKPDGLREAEESVTRHYLFESGDAPRDARRARRSADALLELVDVTRNNVRGLSVSFPLGVLTAVTGVSGSGKSTLVTRAIPDLLGSETEVGTDDAKGDEGEAVGPAEDTSSLLLSPSPERTRGRAIAADHGIRRVVQVSQRPIGRTPRSNVATYTGLFDRVRTLFAATPEARRRRYGAARFSFNRPSGRCPACKGEGTIEVELLFLPTVQAPCTTCGGTRFNAETLEIELDGRSVADVLAMSVTAARAAFDDPELVRHLDALIDVGLGYVSLGQPATELSGGEAQRVKLASELRRAPRGDTLYLLDEPTSGLHPADADRLLRHLQHLVDAGNTVIIVEHDMRVVAQADWVIDLGPGAGDAGGSVVAQGTPETVATTPNTRTAPYLAAALAHRGSGK